MNFSNILDLLSYIEKSKAERIDLATGEFKNLFVNYIGYFDDFENKIKTLHKASEKNNWLFFDDKINIDKTSVTLKENGEWTFKAVGEYGKLEGKDLKTL